MTEVWMVVSEWGEWSDYTEDVESVWDSEAGAVSHIVRDLGATLDLRSKGEPSWMLDTEIYPTYYRVDRMAVRHGE